MPKLRTERVALVAAAGAATTAPLWLLPSRTAAGLAGLLHAAATAVAVVLLLQAARRRDAAMRRPRLLLAASLSATAAGALVGVGYTVVHGSVPVPSAVDAVTLLWVPFAVTGFWLVPVREKGLVSAPRVLADAAVTTTALLFTGWVTVIEPVAASGRWSASGEAVEVAYPLLDIFVVTMVLSLLSRVRADLRTFMDCVAIGMLLVALSDARSVHVLAEQGTVPFGWQDATMQAGLFVFGYAAVIRRRTVLTERVVASERDRLLPLVPVLLAVGVGLWRALLQGGLELDECLVAAAMVLAVMVRQVAYTRELTRVAEQHRRSASEDSLTGLASRKAFISRLAEHLSTPGAGAAAVLIADLNGFKEVNDTFGHETGDNALRNFAAALSAASGRHLCSRLGGDEFAVLVVAEDPASEARELAERVQGRSTPSGSGLVMSCSMGIGLVQAGDGAADVLRRADLAMYAAKRSPDRRIAFFEPVMAEANERRHLLMAELEHAVARGEMTLLYQPVFRLADGQLTGAEALLRWTHPLFGSVPPDEFVPLAEDTGHITDLGRWVLDTALAQVASWDAEGRYLRRVLVNAAAAQFTDTLAEEVDGILRHHGVGAHRLTLEITETQLPGLAVNGAMRALRESGVQVAMDDFGSGYSSLAQLSRLPVDVLKLDRELIQGLDAVNGRPVLDAIVSLARALGVVTVAEGVELGAQADEVTGAGVDYVQGFLYGRPVPADVLGRQLPCLTAPPVVPAPRPAPGAPVLRRPVP